MLFKARPKPSPHSVHTWDTAQPGSWGDPIETIDAVAGAWRGYRAAGIDERISEHEDMLAQDAGAIDDYKRIGLTALRILSEAMVLTGRTQFQDVLDLPCGGGRVTRHLRAFMPDARIHVGDVDTDKLNSVVSQFAAERFDFPRDFQGEPARTFDLIFSGSLLTHFDRDLFENTVEFFIRALKPGGIAILTTHGRSNASADLNPQAIAEARKVAEDFRAHMKEQGVSFKAKLDPEQAIHDEFRKDGFGYFVSPSWTSLYGQSYGSSYSSPSWLMRLLEQRSDCVIVGFKERSYGDMQDVVMVQRT